MNPRTKAWRNRLDAVNPHLNPLPEGEEEIQSAVEAGALQIAYS